MSTPTQHAEAPSSPAGPDRASGGSTVAQETLAASSAEGEVVLLGVVGSTAYGLAHEGSDQDRLGVFQAPTVSLLGLAAQALSSKTVVRHEPDMQLHELGKFVSLALAANPTLTELLWLPTHEVCTDAGAALLAARTAFLCESRVRLAFAGYAVAQAKKLAARCEAGAAGFQAGAQGRVAKHARHCLRLLLSGSQLLATGELTVDVSAHREELFAAGELAVADPQAFAAMFTQRLGMLNELRSVLPATPDVDRVEALLRELRLDQLRRSGTC